MSCLRYHKLHLTPICRVALDGRLEMIEKALPGNREGLFLDFDTIFK